MTKHLTENNLSTTSHLPCQTCPKANPNWNFLVIEYNSYIEIPLAYLLEFLISHPVEQDKESIRWMIQFCHQNRLYTDYKNVLQSVELVEDPEWKVISFLLHDHSLVSASLVQSKRSNYCTSCGKVLQLTRYKGSASDEAFR